MDVGKIRIEQDREARSQKTGIQKEGMRERWRTEDGNEGDRGWSDKGVKISDKIFRILLRLLIFVVF